MSKLKTPLRYEAGIIFDAEGEKICNFGISTFAHCDDWGHAHQIIDAVNNQPSPSPIEAGGHTPGDGYDFGLPLVAVRHGSLVEIRADDGCVVCTFSQSDNTTELDELYANLFVDAVNNKPSPSPLLPLLAAWIMRATRSGVPVSAELLDWAQANGGDDHRNLDHDTREAVMGGAS
mgnify:CR=1 FL=1